MKKLIGTVAVAAVLATAAFAELSMGAWLRTIVAPVAYDGEDVKAGWLNSWGSADWGGAIRNARISFNFTSDDGKVGMMYDIFGDQSSGFGAGDYRAIWFQPASWFKAMVGYIDNDYTMDGNVCFGSWNWLRPGNWWYEDEQLTFGLPTRHGLQLEFFPVEGLQILAHLSLNPDGGFADFTDQIKNSLVAVGYTIGDIGTIKVAYVGNYSDVKASEPKKAGFYDKDGKPISEDDDKLIPGLINGEITYIAEDEKNGVSARKTFGNAQVGFDLTAIENVYLTVGAKFNIADGYSDGDEIAKVALGGNFQITDSFGLAASIALKLRDAVSPGMQAGIGINVGLTDVLGLDADVRWKGDLEADEHWISFMVGLNWAMSSNGEMGIGFQATTNGCGFLNGCSDFKAAKSDAFCFAVPIKFGLWF